MASRFDLNSAAFVGSRKDLVSCSLLVKLAAGLKVDWEISLEARLKSILRIRGKQPIALVLASMTEEGSTMPINVEFPQIIWLFEVWFGTEATILQNDFFAR